MGSSLRTLRPGRWHPTPMGPEAFTDSVNSEGPSPRGDSVLPRPGSLNLLQEAVALHDRQPLPHLAEAQGAAGSQKGEEDEDHRVDQVVVHEGVVGGRKHGGPHEYHERRATDCGDPHRYSHDQRDADAGEADHEQRVGPGLSGDAGVELLERAGRTEGEKAFGGAPAADPSVGVCGFVAKTERLVEERPQKDPAQTQSDKSHHIASGASAPGLGGHQLRMHEVRVGKSGGVAALADGAHGVLLWDLCCSCDTHSMSLEQEGREGRTSAASGTKVPRSDQWRGCFVANTAAWVRRSSPSLESRADT